ncbi:hypothetical protein COU37_02430 [Candidatus Micrarchaeota archaeon CG10_big_fil_rev_8_21_14_0_10_45_29]|nr:MAG: hypothetical protein COU37_02430 [Candidatus Micrarchaeota archaeon CG10_big_fil_rev_8_21_14_0_10_45_29]
MKLMGKFSLFAINFVFLLLLLAPALFAGAKWQNPVYFPAEIVGKPIESLSYAYVLTDSGHVYSLSLSQGSSKVAFTLAGGAHSPPAKGEGSIIAGSDAGQIEAHSLSDTKLLWKYPKESQFSFEKEFQNLSLRYLDASGGEVYAVFKDRLIVLNEKDGKVLFDSPLADGQSARAHGGGVFVIDGTQLISFSKLGKILWKANVGPTFNTRPSYDKASSRVYIASTNSLLLAFDASTGTLKYNYRTNGWPMSTPAPAGNALLLGTNEGKVIALSQYDGSLLWESDVGGAVWSEPEIFEKNSKKIAVYGTNANSAVAIDTSNGQILFQYPLSGWGMSPSIADEGRTIIAPARDASIIAISINPICTIDSPKSGELIGQEAEIEGRAFSFDGVKSVQLKINNKPLPPLQLQGKGEFSYPLDLSSEPLTAVQLQCIATDFNGLVEQDMRGYKQMPILSLDAAKISMSAAAVPNSLEKGERFTLYIRNADGEDLQNLLIDYLGEKQEASSPLALYAPKDAGTYDIIAKKAGYEEATAQIRVTSDLGVLPAVGAIIAVLLIAIIAIFIKKSRSKKIKRVY